MVERDEANGGSFTFPSYAALEQAFANEVGTNVESDDEKQTEMFLFILW